MIVFWTNGSTAHPPFCQDITAPPPTHTHTSCSSCLKEVLEWKMQVHIAQQTERNGESNPSPPSFTCISFSLSCTDSDTHTPKILIRVLSKAALIVVNMAIEHRPLSIINHGTVTDTLGQSAASRYDFFSCIFRLEFSCVVYSHEYMHILTIDRLVCKENCRSWWLVLSVKWMRKFCYFGITLPFLV